MYSLNGWAHRLEPYTIEYSRGRITISPVSQGQWSRSTFINLAMVNIFVLRHSGPRSIRLDDMGHFEFRDLEMTQSRSSEVKLSMNNVNTNVNLMLILHYLIPN